METKLMNGNPLGKSTGYSDVFDPALLFPIARAQSRAQLGIKDPLPFQGLDRWTCYELSWLSVEGIPQVGIASFEYPASTANLIESKSFKLFLGSINFTRYGSTQEVADALLGPLRDLLGTDEVSIDIVEPREWAGMRLVSPPGVCVDSSELKSDDPGRLRKAEEIVSEVVHSHLLRSLCPVTSQPDWGTVVIAYRGAKLEHASLVSYLRAHRSHQGFHEECCELLFTDIMAALAPTSLWVGCFYTRRGGLDINPERWLTGTPRLALGGRLARQ